jgi:hypothetical protein
VGVVSKWDGIAFGLAGVFAWLAVTAFYGAFGGELLEQAFWFYVINAAIAATGVMLIFHLTARLRRIPRGRRLLPALIFATPGIVGGSLAMINLLSVFPQFEQVSQGRYGAFLLVGYATLVALAMEPPPSRSR